MRPPPRTGRPTWNDNFSAGYELDEIEKARRHNPGLPSARLDYDLTDMGLRLSVFGVNLTNEKSAGFGLAQGTNGGVTTGIVREPRVYGVPLRYTFGRE